MITVGVDVGGTFTDLVLANMQTAQQVIHKVPTTPGDPSVGVLQGVSELCALARVTPSEVRYVLHGTTTATNAVLEHKGAKTGLITNDGFRDILHIARHQRVEHYSIQHDRECPELCVSELAHAGFRYGHALKRSSNMIAN